MSCIVVQGILQHVRQFVVTREGNDVNSRRKWLTVADAVAEPDSNVDISSAVKDIQRRLEEMRVNAAYQSNSNERGRSQSPRRVQFAVPSRSPSASRDTSDRSRSASADRSWRSSEHERSRASNRQFSQPRQPINIALPCSIKSNCACILNTNEYCSTLQHQVKLCLHLAYK